MREPSKEPSKDYMDSLSIAAADAFPRRIMTAWEPGEGGGEGTSELKKEGTGCKAGGETDPPFLFFSGPD